MLFPIFANSQQLRYVQGEILLQFSDVDKIEAIGKAVPPAYANLFNARSLEPVSKSMNIWKLKFNHNRYNELELLALMRSNPFIQNAQFNFFTENRTVPDDPFFSDLWYLENTGQNGGLAGIDLDALKAWEITSGGLTYNGDTIVICIVDERFDYTHEDLDLNVWRNHAEIPGNNIDDDQNGYVDDYMGWNVNTDNDNISNT